MGMTPAVALTTEAIQPVQAFAAVGENAIAIGDVTISGTDAANATAVTYNPTGYTIEFGTGIDSIVVKDSSDNTVAGTNSVYALTTDSTYSVVATKSGVEQPAVYLKIVPADAVVTIKQDAVTTGLELLSTDQDAQAVKDYVAGILDVKCDGTAIDESAWSVATAKATTDSANPNLQTIAYTLTYTNGNYQTSGTLPEVTYTKTVTPPATDPAETTIALDDASVTAKQVIIEDATSVYSGKPATPVIQKIQAVVGGNFVDIPVPADAAITWKNSDGEEAALVNADSYDVTVKLPDAGVKVGNVTYTGSVETQAAYTITAKVLDFTQPSFFTAGVNLQTATAEILNGVSGFVSGQEAATQCKVQIDSGLNTATVVDTPVVGKVVPLSSNYVFASGTDGFDIPVQDVVKINGENYAVSFKPTKAMNEDWANKSYSYNGKPQAPEVVLTSLTDPTKTATSGYTVLYGLGDVQGNSTKPTDIGEYTVSVQVGAATTPVKVGTYSIDPANVTKANQVAVTWNGQPLFNDKGQQVTSSVSLNDVNDWSDAFKMVYPSSGLPVEEGKAYTALLTPAEGQNPATLDINLTSTGANAVLSGAISQLTLNVAYYKVANVTLAPTFKAPTYDGDVQELDVENDLIVTDSVGNTISSDNFTVTYSNNTNAGTATVIVTGKNNFAGEATTTFTIAKLPVSQLTLTPEFATTTFNGEAQTPFVTVTGTGLAQSGDKVTATENKSKNFTVSYDKNTNAGTAKAIITAADNTNYTGTAEVAFKINPFNLANANAATEAANVAYSATATSYPANIIKLVSGLKDAKNASIKMTEGTDYEIMENVGSLGATTEQAWSKFTWPQGTKQKPVYYTVVGKGNYTGNIAGSYYVTTTPLSTLINAVSVDNPYFDGTYQTPLATITLKTLGLDGKPVQIKSTDEKSGLVVTYANNRNASKNAEVIVTASGTIGTGDDAVAYYGDSQTYNFEIKPAKLTNASFGLVAPKGGVYQYTGSQIKPEVSITAKQNNLLLPVAPQVDATAGMLTTADGTQIPFSAIEGEYTITYGANTAVTKPAAKNYGTVTITPTNGNMVESATRNFEIQAAQIAAKDIDAADFGIYKKQADGATYAEPAVTVTVGGRTLVRNVDYILTVSQNQIVGQDAQWKIVGKGNYTTANNNAGETGDFAVVDDIANATVTLPEETYVYDGAAKQPVPVLTYKSGNQTTVIDTDEYTVSYESNINAGTAYVVITGNNENWGGTVKVPFTIAQAQGELAITGAVADYTYTGAAATPEPDFTFTMGTTVYNKADLVAGTDYKYVYANNIDATAVTGKKATVTVQMLGNYGAKTPVAKEFTIAQANVASANVVVSDVTVGKTPKVAVTMGDRALTEGKDYTFAADTKTPGTKTATITGKGNYTGTQKVTFTVLNENQVPADDADLNGGTWKKTNGVWQYTTKDGKLVSSGWAEINNKWYYFDSKGNAQTGWLELNGTWYYLNKAGEGTECAMVSNAWKKINGNWYHFAKSGAMQTGWQKINGAWYYLNKKGEGTEGAMRTGWQKINGAWYYLNKAGQGTEGAMKTGWFNDNGTWCYLNANGDMVSNQWKQINGSWFYFYASGAMAANTWVGNYWVDANGYWVR